MTTTCSRMTSVLIPVLTLVTAAAACAPTRAQAQALPSVRVPVLAPTPSPALPPAVLTALRQAQVPASSLAVVVQPVGASSGAQDRWRWRADAPMNPASVFKLVTTYAALDTLGPAWQWRTGVATSGSLDGDVLTGSVYLRGTGDPSLTLERTWLLLRELRARGVRDISGDIVLDRSAFRVPPTDAGAFDGEATRPYNVQPDALLLGLHSLVLRFVPEPGRGAARVLSDPPLAGVTVDASVPLSSAPCGDWREALGATLDNPARVAFTGRYPSACGERDWPLAYAAPREYGARMVAALWRELGGTLRGQVRDGLQPANAQWRYDAVSPPLAQVVRDINKYSNNVMAEQVFYTLAREVRGAPGVTPADARAVLADWMARRLGNATGAVVDNGSGLSRRTRVSAAQLAALLQAAWGSPVMSELMASLPVAGSDGTLRRTAVATGRAHLKTGSLRDTVALAGYVMDERGQRWVLVAMVNDERASSARPVLEALLQAVAAPAGVTTTAQASDQNR